MSTNPHHPYWGDNRLAERQTLREFPRDDPRLAKWRAAEARTDEYLAWMCAIGVPIVCYALYYRIF